MLLYLLVKEMFDARAGLIASVGFLLSPIIMINTDAVLVHGVGVFFVMLAVFSLWRARSEPAYYFIVGAAIGLASLTRYPDLLIALVAIIFMLIDLKDSPQRRKSILTWVSLRSCNFSGVMATLVMVVSTGVQGSADQFEAGVNFWYSRSTRNSGTRLVILHQGFT